MTEFEPRQIKLCTQDDAMRFHNLALSLGKRGAELKNGHERFNEYLGDGEHIQIDVWTNRSIRSRKLKIPVSRFSFRPIAIVSLIDLWGTKTAQINNLREIISFTKTG